MGIQKPTAADFKHRICFMAKFIEITEKLEEGDKVQLYACNKTVYNSASNNLKTQVYDIRNKLFQKYITNLNIFTKSI